jgi:hypothetical protein
MNDYRSRKYTEATDDRGPAKPAKSSTECKVNGCPLPGVYRMNNEESLCCVHDGEDAHRWPEQTERILANLRPWWLALSMSNADVGEPVKQVTIDAVLAEGGPDASECKTQRDYARKIRGYLLKKCKGERHIPPAATQLGSLVKKLTEQTL